MQQEQDGRDKQPSQEAQPVTVSVSDQRGVDVTVDSCVHQEVEAKAAGSDTQTLANHTVDVSDSEDPTIRALCDTTSKGSLNNLMAVQPNVWGAIKALDGKHSVALQRTLYV
eukprot:COSAG01_NODE_6865_length_3464_cov_50.271620_3_plen_112_part_00